MSSARDVARVVALQRFPVKAMGGESLDRVQVGPTGLVGDREWAVYGADGKLASGKHSQRFRRMDPVFELTARRTGEGAVWVVLPDGRELELGEPDTDSAVSEHFGERVALRREAAVPHQDGAPVSIVGTATLTELGLHEGDGRPIDPRHLRANVLVETDVPFLEESWVGHQVAVGASVLSVTEATQRCRMVGVAQVGVAARPSLLQVISDRHDLAAGVYASVATPGVVTVGDLVRLMPRR